MNDTITVDIAEGKTAWGDHTPQNGFLLIGTIADKSALFFSPDWRWHKGRSGKILSSGDFASISGEWAKLARKELGTEAIMATTKASLRTWEGYEIGRPIPQSIIYEIIEQLSSIQNSNTKKGKAMKKQEANQLQLAITPDITANPDLRHSPSLRGAHTGPKSLFPAKAMPVQFNSPDGKVWGQGISPIEKRTPDSIAALSVEHLDLMRVIVRYAEMDMKNSGKIEKLSDEYHVPDIPKSIDIPRGTLHALLNPSVPADKLHGGTMVAKTKKLISELEKGVLYYEDDERKIEARILTVTTELDKLGPKKNLHVYHFEFTDKFLELMQVKDSTRRHILLKQLEVGVVARCIFCRVPELITGRSNTANLPLAIPVEDLALQIGVISEKKPPSIVRRAMFGNPATAADLQQGIDELLSELNGKIRATRSDGQERPVRFAFGHSDEVGRDTIFAWFEDKRDMLAESSAINKVIREMWIEAGGSPEEIDRRLVMELEESLLRVCKTQSVKGNPDYSAFNEAVYITCSKVLGSAFLRAVDKVYKAAEKKDSEIESAGSVIWKCIVPELIGEAAEKHQIAP